MKKSISAMYSWSVLKINQRQAKILLDSLHPIMPYADKLGMDDIVSQLDRILEEAGGKNEN